MLLHPKRSLGQNFLIDQNVLGKIVDAIDLDSCDTLLEIGPGRGALTEHLLKTEKPVWAIEKDDSLSRYLRETYPQLEITHQDVLEVDFSCKQRGRVAIVANLPYNISTKILQHLLFSTITIVQIIVMVQKEVGEKVAATAPRATRLSSLLQTFFGVKKLFVVSPNAFRPRPRVDSIVIALQPLKKTHISREHAPAYATFIKEGFREKRKQLSAILATSFPGIPREAWIQALESCGHSGTTRAEALQPADWAQLFLFFSQKMSS